jgi:hypothetical protein
MEQMMECLLANQEQTRANQEEMKAHQDKMEAAIKNMK